MGEVMALVDKVAPTAATVLIEGESGTGKELVARSIHYNSQRHNETFITVNCTALPESLLESELFGHEKGAFTGAGSMRKGRFELASKGTIFLDEIGELSPALQVKLLRVIQEKTIERVGSARPLKVDFRLITATNKNLKEEVRAGRFRDDLYYRLNVVTVHLPPLRERLEDIPLLARHFLEQAMERHSMTGRLRGFDPECEKMLLKAPWPGNVRQLENTVERAMILCPGDLVTISDLPPDIFDPCETMPASSDIDTSMGLYDALVNYEKRIIVQALKRSKGVQSHAARLLKIGKSGLNQKIKKLGIDHVMMK